MMPPPLPQSATYADTLTMMGRQADRLSTPEGRPVVMLRRRVGPVPVCYLPRPDLGHQRAEVLRHLPAHATVLINADTPLRLRGCLPILTPQHVAELHRPGQPGPDPLLTRMHGKWRNRLRRAMDGPLRAEAGPFRPAAHAPLLAEEARQRRRRGYRGYPPAFLDAWTRAAPDQARFYQARRGSATVAFMLFLLHEGAASYAIGWTGPEGRRHHAHPLLMWTAMTDLFARDIRRIDLGPVDTDGGAGRARFKLGCGATLRRLGPTLLSPPGFRVSP
jgi:hypothetical protein